MELPMELLMALLSKDRLSMVDLMEMMMGGLKELWLEMSMMEA